MCQSTIAERAELVRWLAEDEATIRGHLMVLIPDAGSASVGTGAAKAGGFGDLFSKDAAKASSAAKEMLSSAKSGGFRISDNAAKGLMQVLDKMDVDLDDLRAKGMILQEDPKLGEHDYGKRVSAHDLKSADGDSGVIRALDELSSVVRDARDALKIAIDNYHKQEDDAASTFQQG